MAAHILIIEDNKASMDLLTLLLKAYGHSVIQAEDGERGLALAAQEMPDLILCDIHLPKMDGYAVVRTLKNDLRLRHIPIISVTALAMAGDCEKLLAEGFNGYISKPIEPENFIGEIEEMLPPYKRSPGLQKTILSVQTAPIIQIAPTYTKVLVVDDSAVNRDLLRVTLEPSGYDLTVVADVQDGLTCAKASHYDLIISDVHMPDEDGFIFLDMVKKDPLLHPIPFMLISSTSDSEADSRRAKAAGAACFIRRPIEPHILLEHISACLKRPQNIPENGGADGNHSHR